MTTERSVFTACEDAGQAAARNGLGKDANPYAKAAPRNSPPLLDHESREQLADAWLRGWEHGRRSGRMSAKGSSAAGAGSA